MKKLLGILLALTMLFCTACGGSTTAKDNANDINNADTTATIYTDITGIAADEVMMTVGEIAISADLFFYWVNAVAADAERVYQQYSMYYPQYATLLNKDGTLNWNATYSQNMTVSDVVLLQAMEKLAYLVITESMAQTNGIELTEEQRTEMATTIDTNIDTYAEKLVEEDAANEALTDAAIEEKYFYNLGIDRATVERLMAVTYLNQGIIESMMTEGHALYVEDEAYNDFAFYADHILIATKDLSTGLALSDEEVEKKTLLAESILSRLQESDDMETLFAELADLHSEDTGRTAYPTGYIFTEGEMVAEFENAVKELEVGELSGLVESSYGYHIILRRDLLEGLQDSPKDKEELTDIYLTTLVNTIIANTAVTTAEVLQELNFGDIYATYMERTGQRENSKDNNLEISDK